MGDRAGGIAAPPLVVRCAAGNEGGHAGNGGDRDGRVRLILDGGSGVEFAWPRPHPVELVFGALLPPPGDRRRRRELAAALMAHITALLDGEPSPAPPWR